MSLIITTFHPYSSHNVILHKILESIISMSLTAPRSNLLSLRQCRNSCDLSGSSTTRRHLRNLSPCCHLRIYSLDALNLRFISDCTASSHPVMIPLLKQYQYTCQHYSAPSHCQHSLFHLAIRRFHCPVSLCSSGHLHMPMLFLIGQGMLHFLLPDSSMTMSVRSKSLCRSLEYLEYIVVPMLYSPIIGFIKKELANRQITLPQAAYHTPCSHQKLHLSKFLRF